jgi:hypothetical protein
MTRWFERPLPDNPIPGPFDSHNTLFAKRRNDYLVFALARCARFFTPYVSLATPAELRPACEDHR